MIETLEINMTALLTVRVEVVTHRGSKKKKNVHTQEGKI